MSEDIWDNIAGINIFSWLIGVVLVIALAVVGFTPVEGEIPERIIIVQSYFTWTNIFLSYIFVYLYYRLALFLYQRTAAYTLAISDLRHILIASFIPIFNLCALIGHHIVIGIFVSYKTSVNLLDIETRLINGRKQ